MSTSNKVSGNTGGVVGAVVSYTAIKTAPPSSSHNAVSDASSNHTSQGLPPGTFLVTASAPGVVFNSVQVEITAANPQDVPNVNLRSRAVNASNAQQGGF
jgi:hypothetical protein